MSQKIKTSVEIDGSLSASQIANATTDTDKFLVSDGGTIKYRTGAELATDLGISSGTTSKVQHQVKAGVAINKGQAVYVTSADGTNMIVGLASNAAEATSSKTMGLLNATVAANGFADVITEGLLDGLNTIGANAGDPIWLGTGGNLIYGLANKPYAPNHLVFIGIVTRVNANNGEIFVKVQNGFELDEIHDVDLKTTTKVNGHLLGYNGSLWVNKTIAEWLGYTPYNASNPAGYISSYTETDTLASVTARGATTGTSITVGGVFTTKGTNPYIQWQNSAGTRLGYIQHATNLVMSSDTGNIEFTPNSNLAKVIGNFEITGTLSASGYNKTNWDTAFGWGNHASAGYLTSVTNISGYSRSLNGFANQTEYTILDGPANGPVWKVRYDSATANRYIDFGFKDGNGVYYTGLKIYNGDTPTWQGSTLLHAGNYSSYAVPTSRTITINGTSYDLSANRSWTVTASETDTLATVTARGATTSTRPSFDGGITVNGQSYVTNSGYFVSGANGFRWNDSSGSYNNVIMRDNGTTWFRNYLETPDSMRSPIYYDYNNTAYYGDFNSTTRQYQAISFGDSTRYSAINTTINGAGAGDKLILYGDTFNYDARLLVGADYDMLFKSQGNSAGKGSFKFYSGQNCNLAMTIDGSQYTSLTGGLSVAGNSSWFGGYGASSGLAFENQSSFARVVFWNLDFYEWDSGQIMTMNNGYVQANNSFRAPIFYDSADTSYYWNPNTSSGHRFQTPTGYLDLGSMNGSWCHFQTDRPNFYFGSGVHVNGGVTIYGTSSYLDSGRVQAPIFYDSNNTGYYIDAASTSNLNALNVGGNGVLTYGNAPRAANSYVMFYEGFTLNADSMSTNSTGFTYSNGAPYTGPIARFSTGGGYDLWLNASYGGGGTSLAYRTRNGDSGTANSWYRIYSDSYRPYADDSGTTGQRSFNYLYASSYLESSGAVYGTIFYDNNNRGYYMDPDGTSQLSSIYTNNWVRVQGDSGVYSQDYGGHLRRPVNASHGTWEIFGYNKNGYAGMNVYDPQGYNNNYMHESGNGGLYQQNGNGWVFYHSRGNACFGVMTSTTSSSYKLYVGGSIYAEGDVVAYSDRRKKENIVTVDNALDTVNKLRGVYYNRIDDDSKKRQVGVIAQEIQEVLPEVVTYAKDLDEYGVSYGNITGLLIEAIKEQQAQIEELKELVNKLINK